MPKAKHRLIVHGICNNRFKNLIPYSEIKISHKNDNQGKKYVDLIFTTQETDPSHLASNKKMFMEIEHAYMSQGKYVLVNGVNPKDLDLAKMLDKNKASIQAKRTSMDKEDILNEVLDNSKFCPESDDKGRQYVNILYTTNKIDPEYFINIKKIFIEMDQDYKAHGMYILVNGIKPKNLCFNTLYQINEKNFW